MVSIVKFRSAMVVPMPMLMIMPIMPMAPMTKCFSCMGHVNVDVYGGDHDVTHAHDGALCWIYDCVRCSEFMSRTSARRLKSVARSE
uniref:Secreted protein n=1 Tax=Ditylenchus dipsaci TaxID=166011 RepID=A0A915E8Q6_9BILA